MRGTRYKLVLAPPACEQVMVARLLRRHLARLIFDATFRGKKHKELSSFALHRHLAGSWVSNDVLANFLRNRTFGTANYLFPTPDFGLLGTLRSPI